MILELKKDAWKTIRLVVITKNGKSHQVTRSFLHRDNAKNISITINKKDNLSAIFVYKEHQELYKILQDIKSIPYVTGIRY